MWLAMEKVFGLYAKKLDVALGIPRGHNAPMAPGVASWVIHECIFRGYIAAGDCVLDPFAGHGTGLVAALESGMLAVGVEVEPHYHARLSEVLSPYGERAVALCGDSRKLSSFFPASFPPPKLTFTSPPYKNTLRPGDEGPFTKLVWHDELRAQIRKDRRAPEFGAYGVSEGQLGVSKQFESDLADVFTQCAAVMARDGVLVTVTKDYVRDGRRVFMRDITAEAAREAGFALVRLVEAHGASGGPWKRIYNTRAARAGRMDLVITHEDIMFFTLER